MNTIAPASVAPATRRAPSGRWPAPTRLRLDAVSIMTLLSGLTANIVIHVIGELYVGELLLVPTAFFAIVAGRGGRVAARPVFWVLTVSALATLCGYAVSDLIQQTMPDQYLRGWGRILFMLVDVVALSVVVAADRRNFWWFCTGFGVGGFCYLYVIAQVPFGLWKYGYAPAVAYAILCGGTFFGFGLSALLLVLAAGLGIVLDSRAEPVILLAVLLALWLRHADPQRPLKILAAVRRIALPAIGAALVIVLALTATEEFSARRGASNAERALTFLVAPRAIAASPFIGIGSWNENREATELAQQIAEEQGQRFDRRFFFIPHSQILQSWYEGGLLGAAFFLCYGWCLFRMVPALALRRPVDLLTGPMLYAGLTGIWNLVMSPFAGSHRIHIAMACAAIVIVSIESRRGRK